MQPNLPGYATFREVSHDKQHAIYRGLREKDQQPVLIKTFTSNRPRIEDLARLKNEYDLLKKLDLPILVKALNLIESQNNYFLILEDIGGVTLEKHLRLKTLNLDEKLKLAIQITEALGELQLHDIIHRDIQPGNIIILDNGKIKLTGFDYATKRPKERLSLKSPNLLEGTLAYISPEQTGRMNHEVDYRTDFYSLGVVFYKIFTGDVPFKSFDDMELVYSHIAKTAQSPHETNPEVPEQVSRIIMKLLSKKAEDRYSSSSSLIQDLKQCDEELLQNGSISLFPLAEKDFYHKLQISQKIYGREKQIEKIMGAFQAVCEGSTELFLLSGYPGIGKTSIVNEIQRPILERRGFFVRGKFDQYKANIPYSAFIEAFQDLIQQVLTENDDTITMWRERIKAALGINANVIMDMIPELRYIIGEIPPTPGFDEQEAQNRFNFFFQRFISLYASKESPLIIFLDDLQWVDSASLQLFELILTTLKTEGLFLIGAYRSNEVTPLHPLITATERIKRSGGKIEEVEVVPLTKHDSLRLISDSLHLTEEACKPLCAVVYEKTRGNPFFINQFLTYLYEEDLLYVDKDSNMWSWNLEKIHELEVSDNVVELLILKLKKCSHEAQEVLEIAACIGNNFDVRLIAKIMEQPLNFVSTKLLEPIQEGLILPSDELQSFLWIDPEEYKNNHQATKSPSQAFHFLHDKVQQAAYQLMDHEKRKRTHYKIGLVLLKKHKDEQLEDHIFEVMAQLNHAADLIVETKEREDYAKMNLMAAEKAMRTVAYATALDFIKVGIAFLPKEHFEKHYDLTKELYLYAAEANYLLFNFDEASRLFEQILQFARSDKEKISVCTLKVKLYISSANYKEAIKWARTGLKLLNIDIPQSHLKLHVIKQFIILKFNLLGKEIENLASLPIIQDESEIQIMKLLYLLVTPAYLTSKDFFAFVVLKGLNMTLKYGNAPMTSYLYASYGIILNAIFEDFKGSFDYGKLALELTQKFENHEYVPATKFLVGTFLNPTQRHLRTSIDILQTGYELGTSRGDFISAVFCQGMMVTDKYLTAFNIETLMKEINECLEYVSRIKSHNRGYVFNALKQASLALQGKTYNPSTMQSDDFNEEAFFQMLRDNNFLITLYFSYTFKMQICYLFENYELAIEIGKKTDELTFCVMGQPMRLENDFYYGLSLAANYVLKDRSTQKAYRKKLSKLLKRLRTWAKAVPENYWHKYLTLRAEVARIDGDKELAVECYDEAISSAKTNTYAQNEGIACELFAKFYLSQNRSHIAKQYLIDAHYAFYLWGATAKMEQIAVKYKDILQYYNPNEFKQYKIANGYENLMESTQGENALDLMAVVKATQTLSGEIVLNRLIDQLMHIVVEIAGAQKGALILEKNNALIFEAEYDPELSENTIRSEVQFKEKKERIPISVVNYVLRTKESIVIDEATLHPLFANDTYIVKNRVQSILCIPLEHQGKMIGLLYLENNLTTRAFTPTHEEVLKLLTAQIATSIENSLLYSQQTELSNELKISNEKLEDYSHNLENRVYNRTKELNEKNKQLEETLQQIKEMQKKLIQQEKLVSMASVTKNIASEVRNPLNYINNFATLSESLLQEIKKSLPQGMDEEQIQLMETNLQKINEHSKKADEIITSMLQQGQDKETLRELTDINKLIRDYADLVYYNYYKKDPLFSLTIETDYDPTIGKIEAMPQNLGRVFYNIIDNACYATDLKKKEVGGNYSPVVSIRTINSDDKVTIIVRDNGIGIPPEILARIFSPFLTTKPSGKGAGMGLSISYDIICQDHGGSIDIKSDEGEYCEVTITLPKYKEGSITPISVTSTFSKPAE
ncbi:MAG: AAA family ATPase [Parachlamydiaceae bacterium]